MARNMRKKSRKNEQNILLSEGIILSGGLHEPREGRLSNLLVRAICLFAIVTGSLGGMLSAFDISYEKWAFFLSAALASLYCASLYCSTLWENAGYILVFIFILNAGFGLQTYISSGFYGILNDIAASATAFFGTTAQISYAEQVENHSLAVSVAMCYFALIGCIFTNGLISRKMRYFAAAVPAVFFLLVPIYLEKEPAGGYVVLLTAGLITVYILRRNRYSCQSPKIKTLQKAAKKHVFLGNYSGKAVMGVVLIVTLLCSIVVGSIALFLPSDSYMTEENRSAFKLRTMDTMENLYLLGVMGLMNFYPNTGGLENGRLGGINSVRLDYETDLNLEFVPYTYERIYLKTFVGAEYLPFENRWSIHDEATRAEGFDPDTADRLEAAFLAGKEGYAKGIMKIKNVAAATGVYLPYYSGDSGKIIGPGMVQEYLFYPLLVNRLEDGAKEPVSDLWLTVPEQNEEAVAGFCREAGLSGTRQEIVDRLRDYFQQEFPYTLSPGITPRKEDFVNYFLTEKRKGYCAHYASSAVLILRHMGIPARYVEGYAIDAANIATDAALTEENPSDYYEGASLLSSGSVISFDASDENAHAWVEIFDENLGWYPIEITPYMTESEETQDSLWDMFLSLFQNGQNEASESEDTGNAAAMLGTIRTSVYQFVRVLVILLLLIPAGLLLKKGMQLYRYRHAGRSEKLLMQYRSMLGSIDRKAGRYGKNGKNKGLRKMKSFEEQVAWLAENGKLSPEAASSKRLSDILNEAAFSRSEISEETLLEACRMLSAVRSS